MREPCTPRDEAPPRRTGRRGGRRWGLLLLAGLAVGVAGGPADAAPKVVASIMPVHSLIANVMAGVGEPELLMHGAVSPHAYALRPSDARRLAEADLVFWIGPGLETTLTKPLRALAGRAQVVALAEVGGIALLPARLGGVWQGRADAEQEPHGHDEPVAEHTHDEPAAEHTHDEPAADHPHDAPGAEAADDGHGHGAESGHQHGDDLAGRRYDPHLWLDPHNASLIVGAAVAFLSAADPANAGRYEDNGAATLDRLGALDRELTHRLAPVRAVPYVVFHDAYQYFERHYGLAALGAVALSPERPPGARRLRDIRRRIAEARAACVFSEPQFRPALVETVLEGTAAGAGVLDPLGGALAPGPEAYFEMMRALADSLMGCLAPRGAG